MSLEHTNGCSAEAVFLRVTATTGHRLLDNRAATTRKKGSGQLATSINQYWRKWPTDVGENDEDEEDVDESGDKGVYKIGED